MLFFFFLEREREDGRERGRDTMMRERNADQLPSVHAPARDQTSNPGTCPDWESNRRPFGLQDNAHLNHINHGEERIL